MAGVRNRSISYSHELTDMSINDHPDYAQSCPRRRADCVIMD